MKGIQFMNGLIREHLLHLHTAMPCRVESYSESARRAVVQPLFMTKEVGQDPEALPLIQDVPALTQRYRVEGGEVREYVPVYQTGDVVLVAFAERALDNVLGGQPAYPGIRRHHSLEDAIIIGVIG